MERDILKELICLSHLMHRTLNSEACGFMEGGLTGKRAAVLNFVVEASDYRDVMQKEIEAVFEIRRSSATSLLQDLEKLGYVVRENLSYDARCKKIVPTDKARQCYNGVKEGFSKLSIKMGEGLSEEEKDAFFAVIDKMTANLKDFE